MTRDDFYSRMESHIGGLVRVKFGNEAGALVLVERSPEGEVGLVLSAKRVGGSGGVLGMEVELLMGGKLGKFLVFSDEIEFIGGAE